MSEKLKYKLCASSPWQLTCLIFAIIGFVDLIPEVEFTSTKLLNFFCNLIVGVSVLGGIYLLCRFIIHKTKSVTKLLRICTLNNGNSLYLVFDDILNPTQINYKERINIIIPANTTFETLVNNTVVSSKTLHGKAINELSKTQEHTSIRKALKRSLLKKEIKPINEIGNSTSDTYPVGSIASICTNGPKCYHFLALSTFLNNVAHTSVNDLYVAINRLVKQLGEISQGFPVLIPILGSDLSRTHLDQNDILRLLILTIMMHKEKMTSNIYIVTLEEKRMSLTYPL